MADRSASAASGSSAVDAFVLSGASMAPPAFVVGGEGAMDGRSLASRSRAGSSVGTSGYSESALPLGYEKPGAVGELSARRPDTPGTLRVDANGAMV